MRRISQKEKDFVMTWFVTSVPVAIIYKVFISDWIETLTSVNMKYLGVAAIVFLIGVFYFTEKVK